MSKHTNDDPFAPWNNPMKDSPFAPHNGPDADNPFKPWNSPMTNTDRLTSDEKRYYGVKEKRSWLDDDNDSDW